MALQVAYRQTNLDLVGLLPSTEYTAMVLPRNGKGWGSQWSEPLRATTDPTVLPPQKAAAPAVRPAEGCRVAYVCVPTASTGCRSLVKSAPLGSSGWVRPLWLLRAHLTAPGGSVLARERGRANGRPATASCARARRFQSRRFCSL